MTNAPLNLANTSESRCEEIRLSMGEVLDGVATSMIRSEVESHVRTCVACAREFDQLRVVVEGMRSLAVVKPAAELWTRVEGASGATGGSRSHGDATSEMKAGWSFKRLLLQIWDGGLVSRLNETGTVREPRGVSHGLFCVVLSTALVAFAEAHFGWLYSPVLAAIPLAWMMSLRHESRGPVGFTLAASIAGLGSAWIPQLIPQTAAASWLLLAPAGLLAALAGAQGVATRRVPVTMLGLRLPSAGRAIIGAAIAASLARPDLVPAAAAITAGAGLVTGSVVASLWPARKAA